MSRPMKMLILTTLKGLIEKRTPELRCLRFDKNTSPEWINDGEGWTGDAMQECLNVIAVDYKQVIDHDDYRIYRLQPPRLGKIRVRQLLDGLDGWADA